MISAKTYLTTDDIIDLTILIFVPNLNSVFKALVRCTKSDSRFIFGEEASSKIYH